jgi:hypothetical protein
VVAWGRDDSPEVVLSMIPQPPVREADDIAAPYVFAYIFLVLGWIAAMLDWIFWSRGYA